MPNVTNGPASTFVPAQSLLPDIAVEPLQDIAIYSYASASGTVNDVAVGFPALVGHVRVVVTLAAGDATWTGLQAGNDGQRILLWNSDATGTLTLAVDNAGSLSRNRFKGSSFGYALFPGFSIELVYFSGTVNGWVVR